MADEGSSGRLDEILAHHHNISQLHIALFEQTQGAQRSHEMKSKYDPFSIEVKNAPMHDKSRSRGPDIGFYMVVIRRQ